MAFSAVNLSLYMILLIVPKFCFQYLANLHELINFYSPKNHQKTYGFWWFQGGIQVN